MNRLLNFNSLRVAYLTASVFCLFTLSIYAQQKIEEDEVVRVNADLVVLNVAVTDDNGKHVSGLKKEDFKVFEDNRPQIVTTFSAEETPFAAVILIDTSGSMESRVSLARGAAIRFLDGLRADDVTAVFKFDSKVEGIQEFSNSRDLSPMVYELKAYGMTVLYDAIVRAAQELAIRPEKRKAIIVLSDGMDTRSGASLDKALNSALAIDASVYAVDMSADGGSQTSNKQNAGILKSLAEKTGGRFVATPGGPALREAFQSIVQELGQQYTIGYQPSNLQRDGRWRAIKVELNRPKYQARTRKGYRSPKS
jgi:Ca-activated chloride channel family protein